MTKKKVAKKKYTRKKQPRGRGRESPSSSRRSLARVREDKAFELRLQNHSYREIGKELGVTHGAAHHMVKRVLAELAQSTTDRAIELREIQTRNLQQMIKNMLAKAIRGRAKSNMEAVDRVIKCMNRMAALWGLDEAKKVDLRTTHEDWLEKIK